MDTSRLARWSNKSYHGYLAGETKVATPVDPIHSIVRRPMCGVSTGFGVADPVARPVQVQRATRP